MQMQIVTTAITFSVVRILCWSVKQRARNKWCYNNVVAYSFSIDIFFDCPTIGLLICIEA
jgi:hypothetical protein